MDENLHDYIKGYIKDNHGVTSPEPTPPPPPSQPEPYKFNFWETNPQKNFAPWFLKFCALIILAGLAIAGYYRYQAYQNYQKGLSVWEESEKQIETARNEREGWQTYRNEEYGFEFKYPNTWTTKKEEDYVYFYSENYNEENTDYQPLFFGMEDAVGLSLEDFVIDYGDLLLYSSNKEEIKRDLLSKEIINGSLFITTGANETRRRITYVEIPSKHLVAIFSVEGGSQEQIMLPQILSTFKFIDSTSQSTGTLSGKVTIGPNCPVERVDNPCPTSPEAYAAREFLVLNKDNKQVAKFYGDTQGNFSLTLPAGTYTVTSAKTGMGFMSGTLPKTISIKDGQTSSLNIDVDTGIR